MRPPLSALLLSGGASRRMQCDKALLPYQGTPQLLRAYALLQTLGLKQVRVSINPAQRDEPLRARLPVLVDSVDSAGPVAGILSAQQAFPEDAWLVVACDLPLLDPDTLQTLISARAQNEGAWDAVAFRSRHDGLPEPLCAIWEPASAACLRDRHAAGHLCPRKALLQLRTQLLAPPGHALDNINTPDEAAQARRHLEVT